MSEDNNILNNTDFMRSMSSIAKQYGVTIDDQTSISNIGIMTEMMSNLNDKIMYAVDDIKRESSVVTANKPSSLFKHAAFQGIDLDFSKPARLDFLASIAIDDIIFKGTKLSDGLLGWTYTIHANTKVIGDGLFTYSIPYPIKLMLNVNTSRDYQTRINDMFNTSNFIIDNSENRKFINNYLNDVSETRMSVYAMLTEDKNNGFDESLLLDEFKKDSYNVQTEIVDLGGTKYVAFNFETIQYEYKRFDFRFIDDQFNVFSVPIDDNYIDMRLRYKDPNTSTMMELDHSMLFTTYSSNNRGTLFYIIDNIGGHDEITLIHKGYKSGITVLPNTPLEVYIFETKGDDGNFDTKTMDVSLKYNNVNDIKINLIPITASSGGITMSSNVETMKKYISSFETTKHVYATDRDLQTLYDTYDNGVRSHYVSKFEDDIMRIFNVYAKMNFEFLGNDYLMPTNSIDCNIRLDNSNTFRYNSDTDALDIDTHMQNHSQRNPLNISEDLVIHTEASFDNGDSNVGEFKRHKDILKISNTPTERTYIYTAPFKLIYHTYDGLNQLQLLQNTRDDIFVNKNYIYNNDASRMGFLLKNFNIVKKKNGLIDVLVDIIPNGTDIDNILTLDDSTAIIDNRVVKPKLIIESNDVFNGTLTGDMVAYDDEHNKYTYKFTLRDPVIDVSYIEESDKKLGFTLPTAVTDKPTTINGYDMYDGSDIFNNPKYTQILEGIDTSPYDNTSSIQSYIENSFNIDNWTNKDVYKKYSIVETGYNDIRNRYININGNYNKVDFYKDDRIICLPALGYKFIDIKWKIDKQYDVDDIVYYVTKYNNEIKYKYYKCIVPHNSGDIGEPMNNTGNGYWMSIDQFEANHVATSILFPYKDLPNQDLTPLSIPTVLSKKHSDIEMRFGTIIKVSDEHRISNDVNAGDGSVNVMYLKCIDANKVWELSENEYIFNEGEFKVTESGFQQLSIEPKDLVVYTPSIGYLKKESNTHISENTFAVKLYDSYMNTDDNPAVRFDKYNLDISGLIKPAMLYRYNWVSIKRGYIGDGKTYDKGDYVYNTDNDDNLQSLYRCISGGVSSEASIADNITYFEIVTNISSVVKHYNELRDYNIGDVVYNPNDSNDLWQCISTKEYEHFVDYNTNGTPMLDDLIDGNIDMSNMLPEHTRLKALSFLTHTDLDSIRSLPEGELSDIDAFKSYFLYKIGHRYGVNDIISGDYLMKGDNRIGVLMNKVTDVGIAKPTAIDIFNSDNLNMYICLFVSDDGVVRDNKNLFTHNVQDINGVPISPEDGYMISSLIKIKDVGFLKDVTSVFDVQHKVTKVTGDSYTDIILYLLPVIDYKFYNDNISHVNTILAREIEKINQYKDTVHGLFRTRLLFVNSFGPANKSNVGTLTKYPLLSTDISVKLLVDMYSQSVVLDNDIKMFIYNRINSVDFGTGGGEHFINIIRDLMDTYPNDIKLVQLDSILAKKVLDPYLYTESYVPGVTGSHVPEVINVRLKYDDKVYTPDISITRVYTSNY